MTKTEVQTRKQRKQLRRQFFGAARRLSNLVEKCISLDNYAGCSTLSKIEHATDTFVDCFPLDKEN
jgi:hypothetical protein